jgi:membrane associated rhomboid family serine protease
VPGQRPASHKPKTPARRVAVSNGLAPVLSQGTPRAVILCHCGALFPFGTGGGARNRLIWGMAFLHSGPAHQPAFNAPSVVLWLIAGLAAAHGGRMLLPADRSLQIINDYAFISARYSHAFLAGHNVDPGTWLDRGVPFLSYMALHNDWTHLAMNCLWLLAFGPVVARRFGAGLFLLFFCVCGVLAAGTFLACNWGDPAPMIGASGAISGVMAAAIRLMPAQMPWTRPGEGPLSPLLSRQVLLFSLVWVILSIVVGFTGLGLGGEQGPVAWQAHLGGYAAGLLLAGVFDSWRPGPPAVSVPAIRT